MMKNTKIVMIAAMMTVGFLAGCSSIDEPVGD